MAGRTTSGSQGMDEQQELRIETHLSLVQQLLGVATQELVLMDCNFHLHQRRNCQEWMGTPNVGGPININWTSSLPVHSDVQAEPLDSFVGV